MVRIVTNIKWTPRPATKKKAWNLRKIDEDPELTAQFERELQPLLVAFGEKWACLEAGATQQQLDTANSELGALLQQVTEKVTGQPLTVTPVHQCV